MYPQEVKPKPPKLAENASGNVNKFVMPGLVDEIVWEFRRRKNVIPHARTIAMHRPHIGSGAVYPALIHALFEKVSRLDERQALAEERIRAMSVREYQQLRRVA